MNEDIVSSLAKVMSTMQSLPIYPLAIIALIVIGVGVMFLYISMHRP
jgi:hypothetical protein